MFQYIPRTLSRPQGSSKKKKKRKPVDNKDRGPRKFYWAPDVHILAKQWAALKASGDTTAFDAWIHRQASLVQEYLTGENNEAYSTWRERFQRRKRHQDRFDMREDRDAASSLIASWN